MINCDNANVDRTLWRPKSRRDGGWIRAIAETGRTEDRNSGELTLVPILDRWTQASATAAQGSRFSADLQAGCQPHRYRRVTYTAIGKGGSQQAFCMGARRKCTGVQDVKELGTRETGIKWKKNQTIELTIEDMLDDGRAFGRYEGCAVFVSGGCKW